MHACPHCRAVAIPGLRVRWSSRDFPAHCKACGGLSHVLASTSSAIASLSCVAFCLLLVAALVLASLPLFLAGLAAIVAYNLRAWRRAELFPIAPETVRKEATVQWSLVALAIFLRIFSS